MGEMSEVGGRCSFSEKGTVIPVDVRSGLPRGGSGLESGPGGGDLAKRKFPDRPETKIIHLSVEAWRPSLSTPTAMWGGFGKVGYEQAFFSAEIAEYRI
jgi:hypothetical protein